MPFPLWRLIGSVGRAVALSLLLALGALLSAPTAQASGHAGHHDQATALHHQAAGHHGHAGVATRGDRAGHHGAAQADDVPDDESGPHHGSHCHCISAACSPVYHVQAVELGGYHLPVRHAPPGAMNARALADTDPPAKPPRT